MTELERLQKVVQAQCYVVSHTHMHSLSHTHMHACTHTHALSLTHTYACTHTHTHTRARTHTHTHTHTHTTILTLYTWVPENHSQCLLYWTEADLRYPALDLSDTLSELKCSSVNQTTLCRHNTQTIHLYNVFMWYAHMCTCVQVCTLYAQVCTWYMYVCTLYVPVCTWYVPVCTWYVPVCT